MLILADSDVVRKLAYCELLLEFHQVMVTPPTLMKVLPTLKFQLARKLKAHPSALGNFNSFLAKVTPVPEARHDWAEFFSTLDVGEQQLFSVLCQGTASEIVTGDKNCLSTVSGLCAVQPKLKEILSTKKVWCFEAVVLLLLKKRGFSVVNARVQRWRALHNCPVDLVIDQAFPIQGGSLELASAVLNGFMVQLRQRAPHVELSC